MRIPTVLAIGLLVFGCSRPGGRPPEAYAEKPVSTPHIRPPTFAADKAPSLAAADESASPRPPRPPPRAAPSGPQLAYSYQYGVETPPDRVRALLARHESACTAAGSAACVVTASNIEEQGKDNIHATLSLRVTPAWLATFGAGLARDVRDADGRIVHAAVSSEDLSTQIIDSEAALRAKTTLRDRLQAILQSRPGKTADLVEAETALADVQGELDAKQSELAAMKQRVATSVVDIDYASAGVLAPDNAWSPLNNAVNRFVGTVAFGLAAMFSIVAFLLPWAVVLGGAGWLFRKRLGTMAWPWRRKRSPP